MRRLSKCQFLVCRRFHFRPSQSFPTANPDSYVIGNLISSLTLWIQTPYKTTCSSRYSRPSSWSRRRLLQNDSSIYPARQSEKMGLGQKLGAAAQKLITG